LQEHIFTKTVKQDCCKYGYVHCLEKLGDSVLTINIYGWFAVVVAWKATGLEGHTLPPDAVKSWNTSVQSVRGLGDKYYAKLFHCIIRIFSSLTVAARWRFWII